MYCNCTADEATAAAGKGTDWTNKPFTRHYIGKIQTTSQKFKFCRLLQIIVEPDVWVRHFLILIVLQAFIHKNGQGLVFLATAMMVPAAADIFLFSAQLSFLARTWKDLLAPSPSHNAALTAFSGFFYVVEAQLSSVSPHHAPTHAETPSCLGLHSAKHLVLSSLKFLNCLCLSHRNQWWVIGEYYLHADFVGRV